MPCHLRNPYATRSIAPLDSAAYQRRHDTHTILTTPRLRLAVRAAWWQPVVSRVSTALTQREGEVLRMMVGGLTNPEIGAQLAISADTVKEHVHKIANKLTARNRTQAVKIAVGIGLVPWRAVERSWPLQRQHGAVAG